MKKRVVFGINTKQFAITPSVGIVIPKYDYLFRIAFIWGPFCVSIGCWRVKADE